MFSGRLNTYSKAQRTSLLRELLRRRRTRSCMESLVTWEISRSIEVHLMASIARLDAIKCSFYAARGRASNHALRVSMEFQGEMTHLCPLLLEHTCLYCMEKGVHHFTECFRRPFFSSGAGWYRFGGWLWSSLAKGCCLPRGRTSRPPEFWDIV
jgi:hypothetical protein